MGWLFEYLPLLIVVLVVSAVVRAARQAARTADRDSAPRAAVEYDPAEAARTRQIQEEIRRKIAERRGQHAAPQPARTPSQPPAPREAEIFVEPPPVSAPPPMTSARSDGMAAVLQRQEELAEQLRALEVERKARERRGAEAAALVRSERQEADARAVLREAIFSDLRDAPTARRAILLREILGPPVALR